MSHAFDVIVIGSGFGGAVTACRAAEAGARVLVLERGRRWNPDNYPRAIHDPWLFDVDHPARKHGWLDLRLFRGMAVAQGAGVGGGSLCYSSVVMEADPDVFDDGWPAELTYAELKPHYDTVRQMLRITTIPDRQQTPRTDLLKTGAESQGFGGRFAKAPLAVSFDEKYSYELEDPIDKRHTKAFQNEQGRWQGTCVHLGNCDIGCDVRAKNTLDVNYLAWAERLGAQIRPLHVVRSIEPLENSYRIHYDRIQDGRLLPGSVRGDRVVIAAGSLGSTEILLRCRDQFGTLGKLNGRLGKRWSANGNFLTPAHYSRDEEVRQGIGPTISAFLDFMDGSQEGHRFVVEDDGFPNVWLHALRGKFANRLFSPIGWSLQPSWRRSLTEDNPLANIMVWLGAGIDDGHGELQLQRRWNKPWEKKLGLKWNRRSNEQLINTIIELHGKLTYATDGKLYVPLYWRLLRSLVTVHPLGGCGMGASPEEGVVDHRCEVFGYPNLYVIDGSVLPRPVGRNPSMTIAAIAERAAGHMWNY